MGMGLRGKIEAVEAASKERRAAGGSVMASILSRKAAHEEAVEIETSRIRDYAGHPFSLGTDAEIAELAESIRTLGQLQAAIVRPAGGSGDEREYEMLSGHRRLEAIRRHTDIGRIKAKVVECDDDEAAYIMAATNATQRQNVKYSELAKAYRLCWEAEKKAAGRPGAGAEKEDNARNDAIVAAKLGVGRTTLNDTIRLLKLMPELLELADSRHLPFMVAAGLAALDGERQGMALAAIRKKIRVTSEMVGKLKKAQDKAEAEAALGMGAPASGAGAAATRRRPAYKDAFKALAGYCKKRPETERIDRDELERRVREVIDAMISELE